MSSTRWRLEPFLRQLGARQVDSCDASAYEGATRVHDLNQPIPGDWEGTYDAVIDGGTLEHVFHFPTAIENCMRLVKPGGHLLLFTMANNCCGHGFYQFSPELFYRVLCPENGYQVERMVMFTDGEGFSKILGLEYTFPIAGPWYAVQDPAAIRQRVMLLNHQPTILCVVARKISADSRIRTSPQQSDYVPQWQQAEASGPAPPQGQRLGAWLKQALPESLWRDLLPRLVILIDPFRTWRFRRRFSFRNRRWYDRLSQ
jgi:hypothetical protein